MLSFPSQNDKKIPTGRLNSKKQTRVTANQHILKSGLALNLFGVSNTDKYRTTSQCSAGIYMFKIKNKGTRTMPMTF